MRGQILSTGDGSGIILGSDGNRYSFGRGDWRSAAPPAAGAEVDFVASGAAAQEIYLLPAGGREPGGEPVPRAAPAPEGSSVVLGIIGIGCLVLGFVIPILPTIGALVIGLVGADSARRHNNETGLVLSRIAWIGAIVMFVVGIVLIATAAMFAWPFIEMLIEYVDRVFEAEMAQTALLVL